MLARNCYRFCMGRRAYFQTANVYSIVDINKKPIRRRVPLTYSAVFACRELISNSPEYGDQPFLKWVLIPAIQKYSMTFPCHSNIDSELLVRLHKPHLPQPG